MPYPNVRNMPALLPSHNLSENLLLPLIIPLDHDHDGIAGFEIRVLVMERIPAHDDCAVGEIAEHAAGVFARNGCSAAAADGVAQAGFVEGVRNGFLDGDLKGACLAVKLLDHAGQLIARMVLLPQVGDGSIAHIALRLPEALVNTGSFDEQPRQTSATPCIPGDFDSVLLTGTYIRRQRRGLRRS